MRYQGRRYRWPTTAGAQVAVTKADAYHLLGQAGMIEMSIRRAVDPEGLLAEAFDKAGLRHPALQVSRASRLLTLVENTPARRLTKIRRWMREQAGAGAALANRPASQDTGRLCHDPKAERLVELLNGDDESGPDPVQLLKFRGFWFQVSDRTWDDFIDAEDADEKKLPRYIPCLLTYPLSTPYLFLIDGARIGSREAPEVTWERDGREVIPVTPMWSLDGICNAIVDAYEDVYGHPEEFGIWGHDMGDLVIEELVWYPDLNVLVPGMGS